MAKARETAYELRIEEERRHFDDLVQFDDLPPIYHYWSHTYIRPLLRPIGASHPRELIGNYFEKSARRCGATSPVFASIGSGDANNEIDVARQLIHAGVTDFAIECVEFNPSLIDRARAAASAAGVGAHLTFTCADFNAWQPARRYDGIMANQSLHHVTNLEGLFDAIAGALRPGAVFVVNDIIGRNGHQRWPEARHFVERFWRELPQSYRYHRQLKRRETWFQDWDCSSEGFEGIRAQDVLPLLIERFSFEVFVGYGAAIDPFVDRGFGPNFDASAPWDRAFVDRVQACDEVALLEGVLTPTHMIAVLGLHAPQEAPFYARGLSPEASVRAPDRPVSAALLQRADEILVEHGAVAELDVPVRGHARLIGDVAGWYTDSWAGEALEFSVLAQRTITSIEVSVLFPEMASEDTIMAMDIDGRRAGDVPATRETTLVCAVHIPAGQRAGIRLWANKTINLRALGLGADERDLSFQLLGILFQTA